MTYERVKRLLDIVFALLLLLILMPMIITFSFLIVYFMGRPLFYFQERPGKNKSNIKLIKFRTMINKETVNGNKLSDRERLTKFGIFLRRLSFDELPQLLNILRGDMSFVGPRPLLVRYLPFYTERENKRFEVTPGITGLSQIKGRNSLEWDERLEYDVIYVETMSFQKDLYIVLLTIVNIFRMKDVAVDPSELMQDLDITRRLS